MAYQISPLQKSLQEMRETCENVLEILNDPYKPPEVMVEATRSLVQKAWACEVQMAAVMLRG